MNDLHGFQDVVDTIKEGMRDVRFDEPSVETTFVPPRPSSTSRTTVWVGALAFAVVVAIAAPLLLLTGADPEAPEPETPVGGSTPSTDVSQPAPVWPPPIPTVEVPGGATWVCPDVQASEGDRLLDAAQVPDDLRYLTTSGTEVATKAWGIHRGQACGRGPSLVAVRFADPEQTRNSAVVTVWVEAESAEIAMWNWVDPTPTRPNDEITMDDGFTIRYTPETETAPPNVEMVGVLDGLPVWITSSGLTPDQLSLIVNEVTADAVSGQVELTSQDFTVVHTSQVNARLTDIVEWYVEIDDPTNTISDVEIRYEPGFNPYDIEAGWFTYIPVDDTVGVFGREGGGTARLSWEIAPGVVATVIGGGTADELVEFGERLVLVGPGEPRIPPIKP